MSAPGRELLVYRFGPDASFEGQLVGAIQRIESGDAIRFVDGLFIARGQMGGDLIAATLGTAGPGGSRGSVYSLLSFRLDPKMQVKITERTRSAEGGAEIFALAERLPPGNALFAVLVEHVWSQTLADAVERAGGERATAEGAQSDSIVELLARISEVTGLDA